MFFWRCGMASLPAGTGGRLTWCIWPEKWGSASPECGPTAHPAEHPPPSTGADCATRCASLPPLPPGAGQPLTARPGHPRTGPGRASPATVRHPRRHPRSARLAAAGGAATWGRPGRPRGRRSTCRRSRGPRAGLRRGAHSLAVQLLRLAVGSGATQLRGADAQSASGSHDRRTDGGVLLLALVGVESVVGAQRWHVQPHPIVAKQLDVHAVAVLGLETEGRVELEQCGVPVLVCVLVVDKRVAGARQPRHLSFSAALSKASSTTAGTALAPDSATTRIRSAASVAALS